MKSKLLLPFFIVLTLTSCTTNDAQRIVTAIESNDPAKQIAAVVREKGREYRKSPKKLIHDLEQLPQLMQNLKLVVHGVWGVKFGQLPGRKKYVKYTNDYQSKAEVDFAAGLITVETIAQKQPLEQLKKAIVLTLLTSNDPANTDIFSSDAPVLAGKPYLYQQVVDQDGKAIAYQWRANRFAEYLIKNQLKTRKVVKHNSHFVQISMVSSHTDLRKQQYSEHVLAAANQYKVAPNLIYAIIETESSFNPFAVSSANAYGLMQIIPSTAGKDVYDKVLNRPGMPSRQLLFQPKDNIQIGTAYLQLLNNRYLAKIDHPQSRHYSIISAYNGGAGNVFKTFSASRDAAPTVINRLSPSRVYDKLTNDHPKAESRRYLQKVIKAKANY